MMDVDYLHRGMAVGGQCYADLLLTLQETRGALGQTLLWNSSETR